MYLYLCRYIWIINEEKGERGEKRNRKGEREGEGEGQKKTELINRINRDAVRS